YLDVALNGVDINGKVLSRIYRNDGGSKFTDIGAGLEGVANGSVAWGDYDNDGRLDLLIAGGKVGGGKLTLIYRNQGNGNFTNIGTELPGVEDSSLAWGDYNNDG